MKYKKIDEILIINMSILKSVHISYVNFGGSSLSIFDLVKSYGSLNNNLDFSYWQVVFFILMYNFSHDKKGQISKHLKFIRKIM